MEKNILSILDVKQEIGELIDLGIKLKNEIKNGKSFDYLKNKKMVMIFERASMRTRLSSELSMNLLGGYAVYLNKDDIAIGRREAVKDIALVLSRYADIIVYRALKKEDLQEMAQHATVPVINGLDRDEHPCQILADLMTIKEHKGRLNGLTLAFVGDGDDNLTHSYLLGCTSVGMNVIVISPKEYWPNTIFVDKAKNISETNNCKVTITDDISYVKNADILVTDTWISLWDEDERQQRLEDFNFFKITQEIMSIAKPDALFMHCMPIYYGEEVVQEVAHGPRSIILDEAENRLWMQMALITKILNPNYSI